MRFCSFDAKITKASNGKRIFFAVSCDMDLSQMQIKRFKRICFANGINVHPKQKRALYAIFHKNN